MLNNNTCIIFHICNVAFFIFYKISATILWLNMCTIDNSRNMNNIIYTLFCFSYSETLHISTTRNKVTEILQNDDKTMVDKELL